MTPIRLLIVDDVLQVRLHLRTALTLAGGIDVIGEAANGQEAIELAVRLRPDVVLMDLGMPLLDGFQAARQIRTQAPECRILALTIHTDCDTRRRALQAGIADFVVKGTPLETLIATILKK